MGYQEELVLTFFSSLEIGFGVWHAASHNLNPVYPG